MTKPLARCQLTGGLVLLDRMFEHVFNVDPGLDRPESFDVSMVITQLKGAVEAEIQLRDALDGLPRAQYPPTFLHFSGDLLP